MNVDNWLGIGPHKVPVAGKRGPEVTFDHFLDYGLRGPDFREQAPVLSEHMYVNNVRSLVSLTQEEHTEAIGILEAAMNAPPSLGRDAAAEESRGRRKCRPKRCR